MYKRQAKTVNKTKDIYDYFSEYDYKNESALTAHVPKQVDVVYGWLRPAQAYGKTRRPKKYPAHVRIATKKTPKHEVTVRNGDERIHCLDFANVTELHFYERDREAYKHT